jgi:hypothetical protein
LGREGWDERRRGDGAGLGESESQGMTVGGRWRKEGSALAAPAAVVAAA